MAPASAIFTPRPHRALEPSTSAVTAPAPPLAIGITAISAATITGTAQRAPSDEAISHTVYQLLVHGGDGASWAVERRFSTFRALRRSLLWDPCLALELPDLGSRLSDGLHAPVVSARRERLQLFLDALLHSRDALLRSQAACAAAAAFLAPTGTAAAAMDASPPPRFAADGCGWTPATAAADAAPAEAAGAGWSVTPATGLGALGMLGALRTSTAAATAAACARDAAAAVASGDGGGGGGGGGSGGGGSGGSGRSGVGGGCGGGAGGGAGAGSEGERPTSPAATLEQVEAALAERGQARDQVEMLRGHKRVLKKEVPTSPPQAQPKSQPKSQPKPFILT